MNQDKTMKKGRKKFIFYGLLTVFVISALGVYVPTPRPHIQHWILAGSEHELNVCGEKEGSEKEGFEKEGFEKEGSEKKDFEKKGFCVRYKGELFMDKYGNKVRKLASQYCDKNAIADADCDLSEVK